MHETAFSSVLSVFVLFIDRAEVVYREIATKKRSCKCFYANWKLNFYFLVVADSNATNLQSAPA